MKNSTCSLQNKWLFAETTMKKSRSLGCCCYALVLPWVPWKLEPSSWDAWASGWGWLAFHRREIQVTDWDWWCNNHHEKYESMGRMTTHIWNGKSKPCLKPPTSRNMETSIRYQKELGSFGHFIRPWWHARAMHFASPTERVHTNIVSNTHFAPIQQVDFEMW